MLFLRENKVQIVVWLVVLLLFALGAFLYHLESAKADRLTKENGALSLQLSIDKKTIDTIQQDQKKVAVVHKDTVTETRKIDQKKRKFKASLDKHDLGRLLYEKPGLMEKLINNRAKHEQDCLEKITAGESASCD